MQTEKLEATRSAQRQTQAHLALEFLAFMTKPIAASSKAMSLSPKRERVNSQSKRYRNAGSGKYTQ